MTKFIELAKPKWNRDAKMKLIESITDTQKRKEALYNLLVSLDKPWPKEVEAFATNTFKTA